MGAALCSLGQFAPWITIRIDAKLKTKLNAERFQVGSLEYYELSADSLKPFNVVVAQWAPVEGDLKGVEMYREKIPLLLDFVRAGGGLLITCEDRYSAYKTLNLLLSKLDAAVVPENIVDEATTFRQTRYLQYYFASTTNITQHAVTKGVNKLYYPLSHSPSEGRGTLPLQLGPEGRYHVRIY